MLLECVCVCVLLLSLNPAVKGSEICLLPKRMKNYGKTARFIIMEECIINLELSS